jgi:pantoate kinase
MRVVTTFSPGHITGFFQICDQPMDPLLKGSRGAGVSITHGVTTRVSVKKSSKTFVKIGINGNITESAEVSEHVIKTFLSRVEGNYIVSVEHNVKIPIGSGYGASGAGALSLALALNKVFDLGLTRIEAAQVAHIAEVKCKTGLGTVIAETYGGLEIRMKPGAPGIGEIKNIHLTDEYAIVCLNFDSISTKEVLINEKLSQKINKAGEKLVYELLMQPTPNMFMEFSRKFAEQVGLISERMWKTLREADRKGFTCSMPMLGESVFSLIKRDAVEELLKIFHKHALSGHSIIVAGIDFKGARIL